MNYAVQVCPDRDRECGDFPRNWCANCPKNGDNMTPEQKAKYYGVPLVPRRMPEPLNPSHGVVAICGECGLEMRATMGYVCPNMKCPTGMGPITC